MASFKDKSLEKLFDAILALETKQDCYNFFEDLCTIKEIQDMTQRFETAILLNEGKSYQAIAEETGVSSATIGRVAKCLNYGAGGYTKALSQLENK